MFIDKNERLALILSAITVILFIIAIAIFISNGAHGAFYAVVTIAFISGFLNAWVISKTEIKEDTSGVTEAKPPVMQPAERRHPKSKRRHAGRRPASDRHS